MPLLLVGDVGIPVIMSNFAHIQIPQDSISRDNSSRNSSTMAEVVVVDVVEAVVDVEVAEEVSSTREAVELQFLQPFQGNMPKVHLRLFLVPCMYFLTPVHSYHLLLDS